MKSGFEEQACKKTMHQAQVRRLCTKQFRFEPLKVKTPPVGMPFISYQILDKSDGNS